MARAGPHGRAGFGVQDCDVPPVIPALSLNFAGRVAWHRTDGYAFASLGNTGAPSAVLYREKRNSRVTDP
jgi:hypothetical protein